MEQGEALLGSCRERGKAGARSSQGPSAGRVLIGREAQSRDSAARPATLVWIALARGPDG